MPPTARRRWTAACGVSQFFTSALKSYLEEGGIDSSLLDIAAITPRNEARFLSDDDIAFYRISTQGVQSSLLQSR